MNFLKTVAGLTKITLNTKNSIASIDGYPLKADLIKGRPLIRLHNYEYGTLDEAGKIIYQIGLWSCEVGCFKVNTYPGDYELSTILSGRLRVRDLKDGQSIEYSQGESIYFCASKDAHATFECEVLEPVTKNYFYVGSSSNPSYEKTIEVVNHTK